MKALAVDEATEIYRKSYWNKICGDELLAGVDYAVLDFAINSGPKRAASYLHVVVGVAQDGRIGPVTLGAVRERNARHIINELCDKRMAFLRGLSTLNTFGKGWTQRVADVRSLALKLASEGTAPAPQPKPQPAEPQRRHGVNWIAVALIVAAVAAAAFFVLR